MRRAFALVLISAALSPVPSALARSKTNQLLLIVSPTGHGPTAAHPFVNVIARFGSEDGTPDPSTFRARLGAANVTPLFKPIQEKGVIVGMRASISPALLILGQERANHLWLHWDFGDGTTSSDPRPVHAFTTDEDLAF